MNKEKQQAPPSEKDPLLIYKSTIDHFIFEAHHTAYLVLRTSIRGNRRSWTLIASARNKMGRAIFIQQTLTRADNTKPAAVTEAKKYAFDCYHDVKQALQSHKLRVLDGQWSSVDKPIEGNILPKYNTYKRARNNNLSAGHVAG